MSRWIDRSITIKIISLMLAMTLWTYVMAEKNPPITDTRTNIPVTLINVEEMANNGIVIVGQRDFRVDVRVRGRRSSVLELKPGDITVEADILGYKKGTNNVPLLVRYPDRVELVEVIPNNIKITLDEIVRPQKQVEVIRNGTPATGFTIMEEVLQPSHVIVRGPEGEVNKVDRVVIEVNVDNVNKSFNDTLPLKALDSRGVEVRNVEILPQTVNIEVKVAKTKVVPIKANLVGESPAGFSVTNVEIVPDKVRVGSITKDVQTIDYLSTSSIDISKLREYTEAMVDIQLPDEVRVINEEDQVALRIYVEPIIEREVEISSVAFSNLSQGKTVKSSSLDPEQKIRVRISGVQSRVNETRERDIYLFINLEDREAGTHVVPIEYRSPQGIEIKILEPKNIEVIIEQDTIE